MTDQTRQQELPPLPDDECIVHIYPSDLERMARNECTATAFSVAVGCPDERSVPLYTSDQMREYARATQAAPSVSAIDLTRLPEPLLAFDDWLNEPPSREVVEPTEVRAYRHEAYGRWKAALTALSAIAAQSKGTV